MWELMEKKASMVTLQLLIWVNNWMYGSGVQRSLAEDRDLGVTGICWRVETIDVIETAQGKKSLKGPAFKV